jgi:Lipase (class 3)
MVSTSGQVGPDYAQLRPLRSGGPLPFPIFKGLVDRLLEGPSGEPDDTVARVLGTCAGYAYSDESTVATMMTRLGLANNRCLRISEIVDAMLIVSNAFVIQSEDNRVMILCYRGTEPVNIINWLTDLAVEPVPIEIPRTQAFATASNGKKMYVHGGFYRNVRATRYVVGEAMKHALDKESILESDRAGQGPPRPDLNQLQALYITGHSLGGAMAALMTILIFTDPDYEPFRELLKGVYTFGQPMVGNPDLARACETSKVNAKPDAESIASLFHRYAYRYDVVPQVPPRQNGPFEHFGQEWRYFETWQKSPATTQMDALGLLETPLDFASRNIPGLSRLQFHHSLDDHGPQNYIQALTPVGQTTEFGDENLGTAAGIQSQSMLSKLSAPLVAMLRTRELAAKLRSPTSAGWG